MTSISGRMLCLAIAPLLLCHEGRHPARRFAIGTAIVAVRTEDVLVVGADSKTTQLETPELSSNTCKLQEAGGVFFAIAGLRRSTDGDFDVPRLAADASRGPGSLDDKVAAFEQSLQAPLRAALITLRSVQPDYYQGRLAKHSAFVEAAFFSNERGKPRLLIRDFKARESGPGLLAIEVGGDELSGPGIAVLGEAREMGMFVEANPILHGMNAIAAARALLDRAVTAHPETVGPPIDIVELDGRSARWVDRKPECGS